MMRLPFDILSQNYVKPKLYLCEVDKTKICELETSEMSGSFKFNAYSELTFTVPRTYTNITTGITNVNPFYDKIEALRLVYLDGFGYFEIQDPEIVSDGIREVKNITAYSLEYTLSQKYLEGIKINKGTKDSEEVLQGMTEILLHAGSYRLTDLILEKIYGWEFIVEDSLQKLVREFEISRVSVYDFIMQDLCDKFNCFAVFDTIDNKIYLYAENLSAKFYGDGETTLFELPTPYDEIGSVTIDGYRTNDWEYYKEFDEFSDELIKGTLVFTNAPDDNALIEITDGSQTKWSTDVYVSFDNLAQEVNVNYSAEDIKTVLTVKGADDLGIENVNMGLPYITDLSYYYSVEWMGEELYKAYTAYNKDYNANQTTYTNNALNMLKLKRNITYLRGRLSLEYTEIQNSESKQGTYYVRVGTPPDCYYEEVKLPDEWLSGVIYYSVDDTALHEDKFADFLNAIFEFYRTGEIEELNKIKEDFAFVKEYPIDLLIEDLESADSTEFKDEAVISFLDEVLEQLGYDILKDPYKKYCERWKEASEEKPNKDDEDTLRIHVANVFIQAIDDEMDARSKEISEKEAEYNNLQEQNLAISDNLLMNVYFKNYYINAGCKESEAEEKALKLLIRLNPFLREDEYTDDNFVVTEIDDDDTRTKIQTELRECGKVELARLCEPRLSFSMEMANIYALSEFQPIVEHFQLGNLINVAIRSNYIKKARILGVDINFEDFSDFTCEFGELTNIKTPASIHAELLSTALTAGKSVASNSSYWDKGIDKVTNLELKIEQGLLGAIDGLYTSDQSVTIDNNGIWLRKVNEDGTFSPYQACLTSNTILMSSDGFKEGSVPKMGMGEFTVDGRTFYGILAEAVLSGYIEGCTIIGGTINIGNGAFVVHEDGSVTMNGNNKVAGYAKEKDVNDLKNRVTIISDTEPENANDGQLWLNTSTTPYSLMVYTNDEWVYFSQHDGQKVYTSKPIEYNSGDLWILAEGEIYPEDDPIYSYGSILKADEKLNWIDATPYITKTISNIEQYFEFNKNSGLKIGQKDEKFYVNISSTRMSFYDKSNGEDVAEQKRDPDEVVYISNKSAVMKKLVVEDDAKFESPASFEKDINICKPDTTAGFSFKIESNGSFSLVVSS